MRLEGFLGVSRLWRAVGVVDEVGEARKSLAGDRDDIAELPRRPGETCSKPSVRLDIEDLEPQVLQEAKDLYRRIAPDERSEVFDLAHDHRAGRSPEQSASAPKEVELAPFDVDLHEVHPRFASGVEVGVESPYRDPHAVRRVANLWRSQAVAPVVPSGDDEEVGLARGCAEGGHLDRHILAAIEP